MLTRSFPMDNIGPRLVLARRPGPQGQRAPALPVPPHPTTTETAMPSPTDSKSPSKPTTRRRFLAAAATGTALGGFPMIARAQPAPITLRFQSTWPVKFIYHELAVDYTKKVAEMTGGRLKIEMLPAGAVVPGPAGDGGREQGRARRRPRHSRLLVRQEHRLRPLRRRPGLRHGRQPAPGLDGVRRRQGALRRDPRRRAARRR